MSEPHESVVVAPGGEIVLSPPFPDEPISRWYWERAERLNPNWYNPNHVFGPEMALLEFSLLRTGWVQCLTVQRDGLWIIDGFHRWSLSRPGGSAEVWKKYGGWVPVIPMDVAVWEAMMITVRINRAKGTHGAARMSHLVRALIDEHHCEREEVALGIGATKAEVDLLYQDDVFVAREVDRTPYSKAWVPEETDPKKRGAGT